MIIERVVVPLEAVGQRLDVFVCEMLNFRYSRTKIKFFIQNGYIVLDGNTVKSSLRIHSGQVVAFSLPEAAVMEGSFRNVRLHVLFEDSSLLVINKPSGLIVHPILGNIRETLVNGLLSYSRKALSDIGGKLRPGIVHRLDKDTSGVMVVARSNKAHRLLVSSFATGRVFKRYLVLVWGEPFEGGEVDIPIGRHPIVRNKMSFFGDHAKPARSSWKVLYSFKVGISLLSVRIYTGRTHQIRVHLSESGYPVVGDMLYGGECHDLSFGIDLEFLKKINRQMLHASWLSFVHPLIKKNIGVFAPLPLDFSILLNVLFEKEYA